MSKNPPSPLLLEQSHFLLTQVEAAKELSSKQYRCNRARRKQPKPRHSSPNCYCPECEAESIATAIWSLKTLWNYDVASPIGKKRRAIRMISIHVV